MSNIYLQLAEDWLYAVRKEESGLPYLDILSEASTDDLDVYLINQNERLAFWINAYNAYNQTLFKERTELYLNKSKYFGRKTFQLLDRSLSLDIIEHDILRKGKPKWGLGFIQNPLLNAQIRKIQPESFDIRIHFALNCGAESCPPIAFYEAEKINKQLETATYNFLEQDVNIKEDCAYVSRLFLAYLGDFGGFTGLKKFIRHYGFLPDGVKKIKFKKWDWSPKPVYFTYA